MNRCDFSGRLTNDPKITSTMSGDVNCKFVLAVDRYHGKKQREAAQNANRQTADFIPCIAWKGAATSISTYLKKGDKLLVSGFIRTSSYEVNGERKYSWELNIDEFEFDNASRPHSPKKADGAGGPAPQAPAQPPSEDSTDASVFESEPVPDSAIPIF